MPVAADVPAELVVEAGAALPAEADADALFPDEMADEEDVRGEAALTELADAARRARIPGRDIVRALNEAPAEPDVRDEEASAAS